jgi:hypothetical protein
MHRMKVSELPQNVTIGGIIYPQAKSVLGFESDDAVKAALNLNSLTEWQGTVDDLMVRIIELAEKDSE